MGLVIPWIVVTCSNTYMMEACSIFLEETLWGCCCKMFVYQQCSFFAGLALHLVELYLIQMPLYSVCQCHLWD